MNAVQITPPWGQKQVIPLLKTHRAELTESSMAPAFSHNLHAVPLGAAECSTAMRDYPIVFQRRDQIGVLEAVAILGIQEKQNLFVMPDGRWDRRTYIPAYVRRYPFSLASIPGKDGKEARVICVDPHAVTENGALLFDDAGAPLPLWFVIE